MMEPDDTFEMKLKGSLDELAATAPAGPDAAGVLGALTRRRRLRLAGVTAAIVAVALGTWVALRPAQPQPVSPPVIAAGAPHPQPPAPVEAPVPSPGSRPWPVPAVSFVAGTPIHGPGAAEANLDELPTLQMPSAATAKGPNTPMRMSIPPLTMPHL